MKKLVLLMLAVLLLGTLTACGNGGKENERKTIVTTIFPVYDWTRVILGDNPGGFTLKLLVENGVDLHSYQPTADDIMTIGGSGMFLYVGGESDDWVKNVLRTTKDAKRREVCLMDVLGDALKAEELVEGMQGEAEEDATDEHIWLSLRNAEALCRVIGEELAAMDPDHAETYRKNAADYIEKLAALDREYAKTVSEGKRRTILFGDRFPFRYMVEDYGLSYYAAFSGCSAETEASFDTISFLAGKMDELSLPCILVLDGSNRKLAETVLRNTSAGRAGIVEMNSIQSVKRSDIDKGTTYLSIMQQNLAALSEALR